MDPAHHHLDPVPSDLAPDGQRAGSVRVRMRVPTIGGVDPRGEEGATLAIVAISLIAILGMVVLTVDLGALLVKRRSMVNAGDAGALAAAETFAQGLAQPGTNEGPAQQQADDLATQNVSNAVRDSFSVSPFPDPQPAAC